MLDTIKLFYVRKLSWKRKDRSISHVPEFTASSNEHPDWKYKEDHCGEGDDGEPDEFGFVSFRSDFYKNVVSNTMMEKKSLPYLTLFFFYLLVSCLNFCLFIKIIRYKISHIIYDLHHTSDIIKGSTRRRLKWVMERQKATMYCLWFSAWILYSLNFYRVINLFAASTFIVFCLFMLIDWHRYILRKI